MTCYSPLRGFRSIDGGFTQDARRAVSKEELCVPCGQCIGCRMGKRADWATRCWCEAQMHEENCFITNTYRDECLPPYGSLRMDDFSKFVRRLRKKFPDNKIKFFSRGEYGPETKRPHYHALMFGVTFHDGVYWRKTEAGEDSFKSELLNEIWGMGHCEFGALTRGSAGYVAHHNVDKLNGDLADMFYSTVDPDTGEVVQLEPERMRMSNRPGIGSSWFDQFETDVFPSNFLVIDGHKVPPPRYFKNKLKDRYELKGSADPSKRLMSVDDYEVISRKAKARALDQSANNTPERMAVREEVARLRVARLKRNAL